MITIIEERNLFLGVNSVNKFGEIWPLGLNLKVLGKFLCVYLVLGKILNLLLQIFGQFSTVVNDQILKNKAGHLVTLL